VPYARYDGLAEWYDAEFAGTGSGRAARAIALRLLGGSPGRLLDLGCGGGNHTAEFSAAGWDVVGVHDLDVPVLHPGYRDTSYRRAAPGIWSDGIRARAGAWHLPLGRFLHCFLDAGLTLEHFEEPEGREYPYAVALRTGK
jgi:SAM-dependent methyltransferase